MKDLPFTDESVKKAGFTLDELRIVDQFAQVGGHTKAYLIISQIREEFQIKVKVLINACFNKSKIEAVDFSELKRHFD